MSWTEGEQNSNSFNQYLSALLRAAGYPRTCTLAGILTNISTGDSLRFSIQCNLGYLNALNDVRKL